MEIENNSNIEVVEKNRRLLIFGNIITKVGNRVHRIAITQVLLSIGSIKLLGSLHALIALPTIIINLFSGTIADIWDKKKILYVTDFICGLACFILAFSTYLDNISISVIIITNIIISICFAFYSPALRALVPTVITKNLIKSTNALVTNIEQIIKIVIPSLTAMLLASKVIGVSTLFMINGISYILSGISEMTISYKHEKTLNHRKKFREVCNSIYDGLYYVRKRKTIKNLLILSMFSNFWFAGFDVFVPYFANEIIRKQQFYGYSLSAMAMGSIVASLFMIRRTKEFVLIKDLVYSKLPQGLCLLIGLIGGEISFLASLFLMSFFFTRYNILFITFVQTNVEQKYLGRVFSVIFTASSILAPLGSLSFGFLSEILGKSSILIIACGLTIFSLMLLPIKEITKIIKD